MITTTLSSATPRFLRGPSLPLRPLLPHQTPNVPLSSSPSAGKKTLIFLSGLSSLSTRSASSSSPIDLPEPSVFPPDGLDSDSDPEPDETDSGDGIEIEVVMVGRNRRRIRARVGVDADLETVWGVLTGYEGLADFLPSLTVSRLLEKGDRFARLYQVGQQELALGLKFNAKGTLECFEEDLGLLPYGRKRDIKFRMVEGDFQTFEGTWSMVQSENEVCEDEEFFMGQEFQTIISYSVELEPKLWLPVSLLEGRLCREVKINLQCVREEAQRVQRVGGDALPAS